LYLLTLSIVVACNGGRTDSDTVTIKLPNAPSAIVAYRDGDGAWTVAAAMPTLTFSALSGNYTVVIGCVLEDGRDISVYAATTAELSTIEYQRECGVETQTISGEVTGLGTSQGAIVFAGQRIAERVFPPDPKYTIGAPRGVRDLIAIRRTNFGADRVVIRRGLSLGTSPITADIDFGGSDAVEVITPAITLSETTTRPTVYSWLWSKGSTWTMLPLHVDSAGFAFGVPSSALVPGDLHILQIEDTSSTPGVWRSITWAVHDLAERMVSMPPVSEATARLNAIQQASGLALTFDWPTAPDAPLYRFGVTQGNLFFEALVSRDSFESPAYAMPDLSQVAGWDSRLALVPNGAWDWWASSDSGSTLEQMTLMLPTKEATIVRTGWRGTGL
jgi:hypothetical protein